MTESNAATTCDLGVVLVTGGAGFLGKHLVGALLAQGCKVRCLDKRETSLRHKNLKTLTGDINDPVLIRKAVKGVDTIFHTAAIIETRASAAVDELSRERAYNINVEATKQLVILARAAGVKRFVYTSSNSVVLDGHPLRGADETLPYTHRIRDLYTETKVIAEKWVLKQNAVDGMLTCAIRPSSIWGPGDQTMFKRIFEQILAGNMHARIGMGKERLDNTFVQNLLQGQIKAAQHLVEGGTAPGQAYFINDDEPVNAFEFVKPVMEAIGVKLPVLAIPGQIVVRSLEVWEYLHTKFGIPSPPLAPTDVERVAVDNYFSVNKARQELGYAPQYDTKKGMEESIHYYKELFEDMKREKELARA